MSLASELDIPESGAVFTFGKSHFADNEPSHFFIKNDPVVEISCGDDYTMVICQQGRVFAFGSNNHGQLGLGHNDTVLRPACLKWLKPRKARQVACGRSHSIILTENNQLYASGDNTEGQLGIGCLDSQSVPQFIEIEGESEPNIKQIAAGAEHTLVLTESGKVYVCGSNAEGQLGLGENIKNSISFKNIPIEKTIKSIACGYYHTVLVADDGDGFIFGDNENQRLSISDTAPRIFNPVAISLGSPIQNAYCGHYHTFFVSENGVIFAAGSNEQGQLGLPRSVIDVNHPTEVNFDKLFDNHAVVKVACGATHSAFITDNGFLYTCGDSSQQKLCLDESPEDFSNNNMHEMESQTNQYLPKRVIILEGFIIHNVACGGCHTIISATKDETNLNNNVINDDTTVPESTVLPELPPLQKVPASIINRMLETDAEPTETTIEESHPDLQEIINEADNANNNEKLSDNDKTSLDSLEPNVSGSHILEINDLSSATEPLAPSAPIEEVKSDVELIKEEILIIEQNVTEKSAMLVKQETVIDIIESKVLEPKTIDILELPSEIQTDVTESVTAVNKNMLKVPETIQHSPVMSTKSEISQKTIKSSNGSQDSENETIVCNSDKSTPQMKQLAKTQAVIPIVRADETIVAVENKISDEADVVHSKINKEIEHQEGKISKFFNGFRNESCMGKNRVISSVDLKEQVAKEEAVQVVGDQTNSRACTIL